MNCKSEQQPDATWPTNQAKIDNRLATYQGPVPQFLIDDESGEPFQLIGSAKNLSRSAGNIQAFVQVALDGLLAGKSGDRITLTLWRLDMTEEEIDACPEV